MIRACLPVLLLLVACAGGRQAPASAVQTSLNGAWYLLDSPVGPPSGRLELEAGQATIRTADGRSFDFSTSVEARGLELRGDDGSVLLAERAGAAVRLYGASGATSIAYPIVPLDRDFLGDWVLRDPLMPAGRPLKLVEGAPGEAAAVVIDGRSIELWAISTPEGPAWVLVPPDNRSPRDGRVWALHGIDAGAWLVTGPLGGKGRVLTRPGSTPPWLGADTGDAPTGGDPYLPTDRREEKSEDR